jgi:hypothetical protein
MIETRQARKIRLIEQSRLEQRRQRHLQKRSQAWIAITALIHEFEFDESDLTRALQCARTWHGEGEEAP